MGFFSFLRDKKNSPDNDEQPTTSNVPPKNMFICEDDPNAKDDNKSGKIILTRTTSIATGSPIDTVFSYLRADNTADGEKDAESNPTADSMNLHVQIICERIQLIFTQVENLYKRRISECKTKIKVFDELGYTNTVLDWQTKLSVNEEEYERLTELKRIYLIEKEKPIIAVETYKEGFVNYIVNNAKEFGGVL